MPKTNCFIIDENTSTLKILALLEAHPFIEVEGSAPNIPEGLVSLLNRRLDMLILNVDLEGSSKLLSRLYAHRKELQIIAISDGLERKTMSYELGAVDYMVKPITPESFCRALDTVSGFLKLANNEHCFFVTTKKGASTKISFDEISHISSVSNYISLYLIDNSSHVLHMPLKEAKSKLPRNFIRIHKTLIVNKNRIKHLIKDKVILIDEKEFKIGETYREDLFSSLYFFDKKK